MPIVFKEIEVVDNSMDWESYKSLKLMNASTIVAATKSMKRLKRYMDEGFGEPTRPMVCGSGTHCVLLEPGVFESRYCVVPEFHLSPENVTAKGDRTDSKSTTFYKNAVKAFANENSGKEFLSRAEYDKIQRAIAAIRSHPEASRLIEACGKNVEVTVTGELFGVPFKGRLDALAPECIVDLKTTADVEPRTFGRMFANLHYGMKLAVYRELVRQSIADRPVVVIAQEMDGDFDTVVYDVPDCVLDAGLSRLKMIVDDYKHAVKTGIWPGVDRGESRVPLVVPNWAMEDAGEELFPGFESVTEPVF